MVDFNLISELDAVGSDLDSELEAMFTGGNSDEQITTLVGSENEEFKSGSILKGRIVGLAGDDMIVDVGLKSEGLIPKNEWDDISEVDVGDEVQVWLENVESDSGYIVLSMASP